MSPTTSAPAGAVVAPGVTHFGGMARPAVGGPVQITDDARARIVAALARHPGKALRLIHQGYG